MNTTRQGSDGFQNSLRPCALDESGLSIGRVKIASMNIIFRMVSAINMCMMKGTIV